MTTTLVAVQRLRRVAGRESDEDDATWLAEAVTRYLAGAADGMRLEDALGLATAPGGAPWWRQECQLERDRLIRRLALPFTGSTAERAHALALMLRRYGGSGWHHDRRNGGPTVPGRERETLFRLFMLDSDPPTSVRRLSDIIAG